MKNLARLTAALAAAAAMLACSGGAQTPAPTPLNCEKGTHQEGDKCVLNEPVSLPAPVSGAGAK